MNIAGVLETMSLASGDEKHDASSESTLDPLFVLYDKILQVDPANPKWEQRDRLILSHGHGPVALYAILAELGFFPREWLSEFMTFDGPLGGHPDRNLVPGIEASTGSLGHGFPLAIGVALALRAKHLDEQRVLVLVGDGDINEGSNWESFLLAPDLGLTNLTAIVIDNRSSTRSLHPLEDKLRSFGWATASVDGRDHAALEEAFARRDASRPTAVVAEVGVFE